jgi:pimeloyl-ACP methyl ester carboxylesterase
MAVTLPGPALGVAAELHFERTGSGPPLVLIHGIGSELCVWEPVLEPLGREFDVIALDLPGFGRSKALPEEVDPSPPVLAAAVGAFLDGLGVERPHVAGNSLGGWVALEMGRAGLARTVTGLSPAGLWGAPLARRAAPTRGTARRVANALRPLLPLLMLSPRVRRLALMNFVAHPERVPRRAATRMVASYGRATAYEATSYAMRSSFLQHAEEIRVPVTLGWGERDRLLRPSPLRAPDVVSGVLPGCGHVPMWDDTAAVVELLRAGASR